MAWQRQEGRRRYACARCCLLPPHPSPRAVPLPPAELNEKNGWGLAIHIDGASGAFVAPFIYPELKWDFRLPNVTSINASGAPGGLGGPVAKCARWRWLLPGAWLG